MKLLTTEFILSKVGFSDHQFLWSNQITRQWEGSSVKIGSKLRNSSSSDLNHFFLSADSYVINEAIRSSGSDKEALLRLVAMGFGIKKLGLQWLLMVTKIFDEIFGNRVCNKASRALMIISFYKAIKSPDSEKEAIRLVAMSLELRNSDSDEFR